MKPTTKNDLQAAVKKLADISINMNSIGKEALNNQIGALSALVDNLPDAPKTSDRY